MRRLDWEDEVRRTMRPDAELEDYVLGLMYEVGELAKLILHSRCENIPLDRARVLQRWGECLWQLAAAEIEYNAPGKRLPSPPTTDMMRHARRILPLVTGMAALSLAGEVRVASDWARLHEEAVATCVASLRIRYPDGRAAAVRKASGAATPRSWVLRYLRRWWRRLRGAKTPEVEP